MAKGKYKEWLEPDKLLLLEGWARDGLTDEQIAKNIGINVATLYGWKNKYDNINNALKKGKEVVDIEVENALLKRALGYEYEYEETTTEVKSDENGNVTERHTKKTKKFIPPDTTAQIFWLKNRRPDKWRDKWEIVDDNAIEKLDEILASVKESVADGKS